jgi:hypothetical protein
MTTVLATIALFALLIAGMSIGIIIADRSLKGTCGGDPARGPDGLPMLCGTCPKKQIKLCPTDNPLVAVAMVGNPSRTITEHDAPKWR